MENRVTYAHDAGYPDKAKGYVKRGEEFIGQLRLIGMEVGTVDCFKSQAVQSPTHEVFKMSIPSPFLVAMRKNGFYSTPFMSDLELFANFSNERGKRLVPCEACLANTGHK